MIASSWRRRMRACLPAAPALAFLAVFFCLPVVEILQGAFHGAGGAIGLDQFHRLASTPVYAHVLGMTFLVSLITALASVILGYPVAYMLAQLGERARGRWLVWLMIPFWTSYLVKTFAWILVLSRTGVLGTLLASLGVQHLPTLVPTLGAVIVGMVHALLPLAVMTMLPIMRTIGAQYRQAANTLGASNAQAFFSIYLPLSAPGVAAAALLVFITSLGFFIVPALLGTPRETMTAQLVISAVLDLFNLPFAGALATVLLVCSFVVFVLYDRVVGLSSLGGEPPAPGSRGQGMALSLLMPCGHAVDAVHGLWRRATGRKGFAVRSGAPLGLKVYAAIVIALLMLPIVIVLPIAFTNADFLAFPPRGFSLRWFETFALSPVWQASLLRSLGVGLSTALAAVALGLGAALAMTRMPRAWSKSVFGLLIAPLIVPRIVTAVGLFYLYARLNLAGTDAGLIIGHTVLAIPYVIVTLAAAFKGYDWRLEDAARILGAGPWARLRTVMLPLLLPAIASAFLFAFLTSFDELTIAIFVSGGLKTTLPKQMWDEIQLSVTPTLAAVSFVLIVAIALIVVLLSMFRRKAQK